MLIGASTGALQPLPHFEFKDDLEGPILQVQFVCEERVHGSAIMSQGFSGAALGDDKGLL